MLTSLSCISFINNPVYYHCCYNTHAKYLRNHGISFINNQVYYGYYRNTYAEYLYNQTIHCVSPYH